MQMQYTEAAISILFLWLFLRLGLIPTVVLVVAVAVMILVPEEEENQLPQPPIHTEVLPMVDLDSHHNTEVGRLALVVVVVVPRLALVLVVVVPRLALVLVDTHTDPADLHMHEEEDMVDGDGIVAVAGILPPVDSLRHRHHPNILEVAAEADNGT